MLVLCLLRTSTRPCSICLCFARKAQATNGCNCLCYVLRPVTLRTVRMGAIKASSCFAWIALRAVLTAGSVAWLTISEGRNCFASARSASTGFAGIFFFQNTTVNFLHVVLNQPGIFTKKKENSFGLALATSCFDNNYPIIPSNYWLMVNLKQPAKALRDAWHAISAVLCLWQEARKKHASSTSFEKAKASAGRGFNTLSVKRRIGNCVTFVYVLLYLLVTVTLRTVTVDLLRT